VKYNVRSENMTVKCVFLEKLNRSSSYKFGYYIILKMRRLLGWLVGWSICLLSLLVKKLVLISHISCRSIC